MAEEKTNEEKELERATSALFTSIVKALPALLVFILIAWCGLSMTFCKDSRTPYERYKEDREQQMQEYIESHPELK